MAFLYITEQGAVLKKRGQRLVVEKDGATLLDTPASKIEGVLVFGNVQVTTQAVHLLLESGIEMALLTSHGKLLGQITSPTTKNIVLRQDQYSRHIDVGFRLNLARAIVEAKAVNGLELLRGFAHNHPETDLNEECHRIDALLLQARSMPDLPSLLGLEGAVARLYFQGFAKMLRHSFQFTARQRRPSPDPVNALLSFGYTLVYGEIGSLLDGMGFDPYLGFYHQPHYGHATLASDLLEEFRTPLVDRLTLNLINNRILQEDDFYLHTASGSVYLKDEPRKRYFQEYERFTSRPMVPSGGEATAGFRGLFKRQAERLKDAVTTGGDYTPYRFLW